MNRYLIIYDLCGKRSDDYHHLIKKIEDLGGSRIQRSSWYLITEMDSEHIYNILSNYVKKEDSLIVLQITKEMLFSMHLTERIACIICECRYHKRM